MCVFNVTNCFFPGWGEYFFFASPNLMERNNSIYFPLFLYRIFVKHTFLICMIVLFGIFTVCFNSAIRDWLLSMKRGGVGEK